MRLPEVTSPVRSCRIGEPGEKNGPSLLSKDGYGRAAAGDHHRVNGVALPPSLPILQVSLHYWNSGAMPRHPDTRQRIERAAVVLFASKGVDATTTKEIAAAVGISEGAIYRHFKSKDELVWHLFSTNYFDLARRIDALLDETPSFAARIDAATGLFCTLFSREAHLFPFRLIPQHGHLRTHQDGI